MDPCSRQRRKEERELKAVRDQSRIGDFCPGGVTSEQYIAECARMATLRDYLETTSFAADPASAKHHGNYPGGLKHHSELVLYQLKWMTDGLGLTWQRPDSPAIIAYCHDLCKIGSYIVDSDGRYQYNYDHPKGHGDLSLRIAEKIVDLADEEKDCIRWHMGGFIAKSEREDCSAAVRRHRNVIAVHVADWWASAVDEQDMTGGSR
jgi:3'-5' exoribonuclease